jgi:hypothetical protein
MYTELETDSPSHLLYLSPSPSLTLSLPHSPFPSIVPFLPIPVTLYGILIILNLYCEGQKVYHSKRP